METLETPLTKLFGIKYPIMLAGMGKVSSPKLTAAVTNAGGIGCLGGFRFTPRMLKLQIKHIKNNLIDKAAPFGIDLLIPKVGGDARATNYDYTKGNLLELIDIMIEEKVKLFVCAVGVCPKKAVKKLHENGILYMNMIGSPKHVKYALEAGADILCCQGGEAGGHTSDIATTCLLPKVIDMVKGKRSALTGQRIYCVAAGGIFDGRGLASALTYGAQAVWLGTRFVACNESGASLEHKQAVVGNTCDNTMRTEIYTGRPLRLMKHSYAVNWETNRKDEMKRLLQNGILPYKDDLENNSETVKVKHVFGYFMGQCSGNIDGVKSAKQIVDEMMEECVSVLRYNASRIRRVSKL